MTKKRKPRKPRTFNNTVNEPISIFIGKSPSDVPHMLEVTRPNGQTEGWLYYSEAVKLRDWLNRYIEWAEWRAKNEQER